jgi:hypothetical protein
VGKQQAREERIFPEAQLHLLRGEIGESQWGKSGIIQLVLHCVNIEQPFPRLPSLLSEANHLIVEQFGQVEGNGIFGV